MPAINGLMTTAPVSNISSIHTNGDGARHKFPVVSVSQSPEDVMSNGMKHNLTQEQAVHATTKGGLADILRTAGYEKDANKIASRHRREVPIAAFVDHCEANSTLTRVGITKSISGLKFNKKNCLHEANPVTPKPVTPEPVIPAEVDEPPLLILSSQLSCLIYRMDEDRDNVGPHHIRQLLAKISTAPAACFPAFPEALRELGEYFPEEFELGMKDLSSYQQRKIEILLKLEDPFAPSGSSFNEDDTPTRVLQHDPEAPQYPVFNSTETSDSFRSRVDWWAKDLGEYIVKKLRNMLE